MSKKHFIALANAIREHNRIESGMHEQFPFTNGHLSVLADFCREQNSNFNRDRWLSYIAGKCGPNGGAIK